VWSFADALIWNWLIAGTDAHAKNYSLLLEGGQVRLAPFYDVASALPYSHERAVQMAMKLGNDYRLHVQRQSTWATMASDLGVDVDQLREHANRLATAAPSAFAKAAAEVEDLPSDLPVRLTSAVAERARRCELMIS
jgi:serine/threonine-protein kinase HipA